MARNLGNVAGYHPLARDASFGAEACICHRCASSPRSEGVHPRAHLSVLLAGVFHARSPLGEALLGPGSLLLGNEGSGYEFRHVDDGGDRSLVFDYDEALLEEVGERVFPRLCVPASPATVGLVACAEQAQWSGDGEALRDAALGLAAVAIEAGREVRREGTGALTVRRVAETLRYIEAHSVEDCALESLATRAGLSRFRYLRVFRALTGQTPRQFVIATRLRAAARALRTTRVPITEVALDAGFNDLSHFAATFARAFGVSARTYRKGAG